VTRRETAAVLGVLGLLVAVSAPELGSNPWQFIPWRIEPGGLFGPLVRAADRSFDVAVPRSAAMLAGLVVALAVPILLALRAVPRWLVVLACAAVIGLLTLPASFLQVGLRDSTEPYAPWIHVNDSTYQIELAGDLVLHGHTPYGRNYRGTGLERWYPAVRADKDVQQVALDHFAYFPGTALTGAAWHLLPRPFDDYRLFVLICTLALFAAVFVFDAPLPWKLAAGAALAANPLAIRGAWFGTADAPSVLLTVLAFALVTRSRYVLAAACLGGAVLLKQFALVALPFFAVMLLTRAVPRRTLYRAAAAFGGILVAGFLPFVIADPGGLWDDTIAYGAQTYRIIGYGLAGVLLKAGILDDRYGPYPFLPLAVLIWLPITAWLLWAQWRSRRLWVGAAAFAVSIFLLLYLGRVFQTSYLIWPFSASLLAFVLAQSPASERDGSSARS
jgi:glycosyl transferase family 87